MAPLAITRGQAAELCRLTPRGFDDWVRRGIVPGPIAGTKRWSLRALERALAGAAPMTDDNNAPASDDPDEIVRQWELAHEGRA